MTVRVKIFGPAAQLMGARELAVEVPDGDPTCARLRAELSVRHPQLTPLLHAGFLAVNQEFAGPAQRLCANDEVAFIGAVSGG